jgi:hypothetical protein
VCSVHCFGFCSLIENCTDLILFWFIASNGNGQGQSTGVTESSQNSSQDEEDFFSFREQQAVSPSVDQELEMYLAEDSKCLNCLVKYPAVKQVFLKFNVGIPSSAPVERLFSAGGQILTPRRCNMSDNHFEMILLLRANKSL